MVIMKLKSFCILLAISIIIGSVSAQNEDELHIPVETDNQFPPDNADLEGLIEGSGSGVIDEPVVDSTTDSIPIPILQNADVSKYPIDDDNIAKPESNSTSLPCPQPCVCNTEGDTDNYIVDCSGYDLKEFPSPIDPRTTTLKLHNNKLTEIPKEVANLKKLRVLNANNNSIMDLALGSVSELPELVTLKLANNRLIEYPKDLKNSLSLTKLEEFDLGGNDMRTGLSKDAFSNLKSLRKLILPSSSSELMLDLCGSLKETLETVCEQSCDVHSIECPDAPQNIDENLFDATLPGMISLNAGIVGNKHPEEKSDVSGTEAPSATTTLSSLPEALVPSKENIPVSEYSLRTEVDKAPSDTKSSSNMDQAPKDVSVDPNVKVGAKTSDSNASSGGGVDKSVIGIVVAGMVVVVAGITIKKNWSSIKKKFSSSPNRAAGERSGANINGAPEEVPLQDKTEKSPV